MQSNLVLGTILLVTACSAQVDALGDVGEIYVGEIFPDLPDLGPSPSDVTIKVTSNADSGPGTLREALSFSFPDGATVLIDFEENLIGEFIQIETPLPAIQGQTPIGPQAVILQGPRVRDPSQRVNIQAGQGIESDIITAFVSLVVRDINIECGAGQRNGLFVSTQAPGVTEFLIIERSSFRFCPLSGIFAINGVKNVLLSEVDASNNRNIGASFVLEERNSPEVFNYLIMDSTFNENDADGLLFDFGADIGPEFRVQNQVVIKNVEAIGNGDDGVKAENGVNLPLITKLRATGNAVSGLCIENDVGIGKLLRSVLDGNSDEGLELEESQLRIKLISKTSISNNGKDGIAFVRQGVRIGKIVKSKINNNGLAGIRIMDTVRFKTRFKRTQIRGNPDGRIVRGGGPLEMHKVDSGDMGILYPNNVGSMQEIGKLGN